MSRLYLSFEDDSNDENYETDETIEKETGETEDTEIKEELVIGELNVDDVHEEKIEKLNEENDIKRESVDDALTSTTDLAAVAEALFLAIEKNGHVDHTSVSIASIILESHKTRMGFKKKKPIITLENFNLNKNNNSRIILEDIKDVLKTVWDVIIRAIKSSIEWLKRFFSHLIYQLEDKTETIKKLSTNILKQRNDYKSNAKSSNGVNKSGDKLWENKKYHFDRSKYLLCPIIARMFTVGDDVIKSGEFVSEFTEISWLVNPSKSSYQKSSEIFNNMFDKTFTGTVKEIVQSQIDGTALNKKLNFDPYDLILDEHNFIVETSFYDKPVKAGNVFYIRKPYLGNFVIAYEFNKCYPAGQGPTLNNDQVLENIKSWDIQTSSVAAKKSNDGFIEYLEDDIIENTTDVVLSILDDLGKYQKSLDKIDTFKKDITDIASFARSAPENKNGSPNMVTTNLVIAAMTNIVGLMDKSSAKFNTYAIDQCNAWCELLEEIYKKEKEIADDKPTT